MVLYFSGTGNSKYVAKRLAGALDDECVNLFDRIKNNDYSEIVSEKPYIIVSPTYGWQIPHILRDWLSHSRLTGSSDIYFVMTCGGEIGNAERYLKKLCSEINMNFKGCAEIVMPENYVAMFAVPDRDEALKIVDRAEPVIDSVITEIAKGKTLGSKKTGIIDKVKSSVVNAAYYPLCLHSKKFFATDKCIGCGKCENACVLNNITLVNGRPVWQDNCTHCMACICTCPVEAIEYGSASKGKPRYICPKL